MLFVRLEATLRMQCRPSAAGCRSARRPSWVDEWSGQRRKKELGRREKAQEKARDWGKGAS